MVMINRCGVARPIAFGLLLILTIAAVPLLAVSFPDASPASPIISSVSPVTTNTSQTITIIGSGFGSGHPQVVTLDDDSVDTTMNSTTPSIAFWDNCLGSGCPVSTGNQWEAGHCCENGYTPIGIRLINWTDTRIIIGGFGDALYSGELIKGECVGPTEYWLICPGDEITVEIWGPHNAGTAQRQTTVPESTGLSVACWASTLLLHASAICYTKLTGWDEPTTMGEAYLGGFGFSYEGYGAGKVTVNAKWGDCTEDSSGFICPWEIIGADVGLYILNGSYTGDSNNKPSYGLNLIIVSAVEATCTKSSVVVGSPTTCKATVTGTGGPPTGTITWSTNGLGKLSKTSCTLSMGSCSVKYTPTSLTYGNSLWGARVMVTADYSGDTINPSSYVVYTLLVTMKPSKTSISCQVGLAEKGSDLTCTAVVKGYLPSGTVRWTRTGTGSISFQSNTCTLVKGRCSVTLSGMESGAVTIQAAYEGDMNNVGSSAARDLTIV